MATFINPWDAQLRQRRTDFYDDDQVDPSAESDPILSDPRIMSVLRVPEQEPELANLPPSPFNRFAAPMGAMGGTSAEPNELPASAAAVGQAGPAAEPEWTGSVGSYRSTPERTFWGDFFGDDFSGAGDYLSGIGRGIMRGVAATGLIEGMPAPEPTPSAAPSSASTPTFPGAAPSLGFSGDASGFSQTAGTPQAPQQPAAEAAPKPPSMRAIRMPNGRIMLTNQDGYKGEEINPREIGRMEGTKTPTGPTGPVRSGSSTYFPPTNLDNDTMRALVRNAASNQDFKNAAGESESGGTLSVMEGSPEMQAERQIEKLLNMQMLGQATNAARVANMTPQEQAQLDNPEIQSGQWMLKNLVGEMQKIPAKTAAKIQMLADPNDPQTFIPDPKLRAAKQREIEQQAAEEMAIWQSVMASMMKQRIPSSY